MYSEVLNKHPSSYNNHPPAPFSEQIRTNGHMIGLVEELEVWIDDHVGDATYITDNTSHMHKVKRESKEERALDINP